MLVRTISCRISPLLAILVAIGGVLCPPPGAEGGEIFSDANDGMLEARGDTLTDLPPTAPWPNVHPATFGDYQLTVGEWYGAGPDGPGAYGLTTIVLPFELPAFGAVANPFLTADLGVMLNPNTGDANSTDIDLYAVRVDSSPAVLPSDWYNGADPDPSATLIQASFLTPASRQGWDGASNNNTDNTGDANLLSYLNAAYDGGNGAGRFVFLRLSYGSDTFASGQDNYNINVREAGQQGEWPVITYTAVPEPTAIALISLGMIVFGGLRGPRK